MHKLAGTFPNLFCKYRTHNLQSPNSPLSWGLTLMANTLQKDQLKPPSWLEAPRDFQLLLQDCSAPILDPPSHQWSDFFMSR